MEILILIFNIVLVVVESGELVRKTCANKKFAFTAVKSQNVPTSSISSMTTAPRLGASCKLITTTYAVCSL